MPATPLLHAQVPSEALPRKRFTRTEVERLIETGIFDGRRYELIDGDLVDKMGQKPPHAYTIQLVLDWLASFLGTGQIRVQLPIEAAGEDREHSVPEPDLAVIAGPKTDYQYRHPRGDGLLLAVEVADSSVAFDLSRKAELYANSGVPEYWVLDLPRRQLVAHSQPQGSQYRRIQMYAEEDLVSFPARAEQIRVAALLPEQT
jgi:Uma2 family endonuclease